MSTCVQGGCGVRRRSSGRGGGSVTVCAVMCLLAEEGALLQSAAWNLVADAWDMSLAPQHCGTRLQVGAVYALRNFAIFLPHFRLGYAYACPTHVCVFSTDGAKSHVHLFRNSRICLMFTQAPSQAPISNPQCVYGSN